MLKILFKLANLSIILLLSFSSGFAQTCPPPSGVTPHVSADGYTLAINWNSMPGVSNYITEISFNHGSQTVAVVSDNFIVCPIPAGTWVIHYSIAVTCPPPDLIESSEDGHIFVTQTDINFAILDTTRRMAILPETSITPNPFTENTSLNFQLKQTADVSLQLYSATGQQYNTGFTNQTLEPGIHNLPIAGAELPIGVYFARLTIHGESTIYKLMKIE